LIAADDAALVSGALRLLTDAALARSLSVAGRGLIEREYSWSKVAELYSALYDMLQP
jgi:glycosyltransferase involved in cell wall biosynthesis